MMKVFSGKNLKGFLIWLYKKTFRTRFLGHLQTVVKNVILYNNIFTNVAITKHKLKLSRYLKPNFWWKAFLKLRRIFFLFSIWVFYHEHSQFPGQQGKGEAIFLILFYHFHPLHRHLEIGQAITAESSLLYIASTRTRTGNPWLPSASR